MKLLGKAVRFAIEAHSGQTWKYTGEPYHKHPVAVATTLLEAGVEDEEVLAAAVLHDVIEDTGWGAADLEERFGPKVAGLVLEVTEVTTHADGSRATRKAIEREHLAKASPEGQSIKLADMLDNGESIVEHDPAFAKVYLREFQALLGVLTKGHPDLRARAASMVTAGLEKLGG